jgi:uncharacterized membrane protein YgcG
MKKLLLLFFTFVLIFACTFLYAANTVSTTATPTTTDTRTMLQKIQDLPKDLIEGTKREVVVGVFSLFIFVVSFIVTIFQTLFTFIGTFLPRVIDFTQPSFYGTYQNAFTEIRNIFYLISYAFLFILFLNSVIVYMWKGQDPGKSILGLVFAFVLLAAYPYICQTIFGIFGEISNRMFSTFNAVKGKNDIFATLNNAAAYFGIDPHKTITDTGINMSTGQLQTTGNLITPTGTAATIEYGITDLASIIDIVTNNYNRSNWFFFINQIIIFIMATAGVLAIFEVIALKGAQLINLFLAYFTGIFACSLVASEETRGSFWQWLIKYAQLWAYNIFWALVLLAINIFAGKITGATDIDKILYFVIIFAGIKLLAKVGGIAEGLIMSRQVMESFGSAFKNDVLAAGALAAGTVMVASKLMPNNSNKVPNINNGTNNQSNTNNASNAGTNTNRSMSAPGQSNSGSSQNPTSGSSQSGRGSGGSGGSGGPSGTSSNQSNTPPRTGPTPNTPSASTQPRRPGGA